MERKRILGGDGLPASAAYSYIIPNNDKNNLLTCEKCYYLLSFGGYFYAFISKLLNFS